MEEQNCNTSVLDDIEENKLVKNNVEDDNNLDEIDSTDNLENVNNIDNINIGQAEGNEITNNTEPEMANCLALSLQSDQKSMVAKNTLVSVVRMTIKTALATLGLGILKLIFK